MGLALYHTPREIKNIYKGLPWWLSDKESSPNAGVKGSIPNQEDPTCGGATKTMCCSY